MNYAVGLDGGGTKTDVIIVDKQGHPLHSFKSGALNINGESEINVARNLKEILSQTDNLMGGLEGCTAICIGAAGVSNERVEKAVEQVLRENGYFGPLKIAGDQETALYGALGKPEGMILISGTGSICYGRNSKGLTHRTGGWGYLIDDEGSGYAIGREILSAVVRAFDGRGSETVLTPMVFRILGISSIQQLIGFVYSRGTNKRDIAALASLLFDACEQVDAVATGLLDKCVSELVGLVVPVAEKLDLLDSELALSGSILEKVEMVRNAFHLKSRSRLPGIRCVFPRNNAAHGAAMMALDMG